MHHLWSYLSWRRLLNILMTESSFWLARLTRRPVQWGVPYSLTIEPTTSCNLRCPECPSGLRKFSRPTGAIEVDFYRRIIDELAPKISYLQLYFQGEPLLHPRFFDLVSYAHHKKIFTSTSSNAHFFSEANALKIIESGLNRLIISFDGTTQEVYQQYRRGGNLQKVKQGIRNLVTAKKKHKSFWPQIVLQFLVVKPNEHQIADARAFAREHGVKLVLKSAQINDLKNAGSLIPTNSRYSRYKKNTDGTYSAKNPMKNYCHRLWTTAVITWDGHIVPCCFDKDARHQMGSLENQTFTKIWQSENYQRFRKKILTNRRAIDICRNCTEGMKVMG